MIVFVDRIDCYWLHSLRSGFRHCFVAVQHGQAWLVCDSLKSHMELTLLDLPKPFDLGSYYANQGHSVLVGQVGSIARPSLALAPLTCVTVAKRLLSIRAASVWTPWQLFSHLLNAEPQIWRAISAHDSTQGLPIRAASELDTAEK